MDSRNRSCLLQLDLLINRSNDPMVTRNHIDFAAVLLVTTHKNGQIREKLLFGKQKRIKQ